MQCISVWNPAKLRPKMEMFHWPGSCSSCCHLSLFLRASDILHMLDVLEPCLTLIILDLQQTMIFHLIIWYLNLYVGGVDLRFLRRSFRSANVGHRWRLRSANMWPDHWWRLWICCFKMICDGKEWRAIIFELFEIFQSPKQINLCSFAFWRLILLESPEAGDLWHLWASGDRTWRGASRLAPVGDGHRRWGLFKDQMFFRDFHNAIASHTQIGDVLWPSLGLRTASLSRIALIGKSECVLASLDFSMKTAKCVPWESSLNPFIIFSFFSQFFRLMSFSMTRKALRLEPGTSSRAFCGVALELNGQRRSATARSSTEMEKTNKR